MRTIDIRGSGGNAFALMGTAENIMRQLQYTTDQQSAILKDMTSGNYEHLLEVFRSNFGDYVELVDSRIDKYEDED